MRKIPLLVAIISIVLSVSCGKRVSEIANTIPDHAFMVASMHPEQIYEKGQISSLVSFTKNIENEMLREVLKDPLKSGIDISEYVYVYMYFLHDNPVIGFTAVLESAGKFTEMLDEMIESSGIEIILHEGYSMIAPDREEGALAWNDDQVIFLMSPNEEYSAQTWQDELISLYELEKENAVTSIIDFVDFSGKMEDMNLWFTGDQLKEILEKTGAVDKMDFQLPIELYNNYGQFFVEFADGAMFVTSETHFSDDVTKMASSMMVAKEELNADLLKLAPGHDLLIGPWHSPSK